MKFFTTTLALIATGTYASTSGGLATEENDLRSLVEALTAPLAAKVEQQSKTIDQQSIKIAYLENKMIQGKKKKLRGLREDEVDQNLEEQYYHEYFDKIKEIDDALTTIQGCLQFDSDDGGTCTVGENAASVAVLSQLTANEGVFTDDIHPNGDGPINVSGSGLTATTLKATGILDSEGLVGASSAPALVLTGDLQVNGAIHSSGTITAKSGTTNSTELTDEAATRLAADTTLQDNIDAEATTRGEDDNTLQANIDAEATTRGEDDNTLQGNIVTEAETRAFADTTLQDNIDAEATTRGEDDFTLQGNIVTEAETRASADSDLQANINAEATARSNADSDLQANIDAEATARSNADSDLQANIDAEAATRDGDDNTLQANIDAEATDRQNADSAEATDRQNADSAEAATRASADTTLQNNIDAEAATRASADNTLQANINNVTNYLQAAPNTQLV